MISSLENSLKNSFFKEDAISFKFSGKIVWLTFNPTPIKIFFTFSPSTLLSVKIPAIFLLL